MKACYQFFPEAGVVAYRIIGNTTLSDFKDLFEEIGSSDLFSSNLRGIADLRKMTFATSVEDIKELARSVRDESEENCSWITIVDEPLVTAFSLLFKKIVSARYQIHVCSTLERASTLAGMDILPFLNALPAMGSERISSDPEV